MRVSSSSSSLSLYLVSGIVLGFFFLHENEVMFCHGFVSTTTRSIVKSSSSWLVPPLRLSSSQPPMMETTMTPTPDDEEVVRTAYNEWRQRYNKDDDNFDPVRYQNFKTNFLAVTAKNDMDRTRAKQTGTPLPPPIQLNEYGDCSAEEYRAIIMTQRTSTGSGSSLLRDPNTRLAPATTSSTSLLQPTNDFNNPKRTPQQQQQQQSTPTTRQQQMSQASSNLRSAMDQRTKLENELLQLKQRLEEKQRSLQQTLQEEQYCQNRIALRQEQKRILNERLTNGWDDERGLL